MGLPKINMPLYEVTIPSTKETKTFRPFTVKEEKILLIANESKDMGQVVLSLKQIINNCVNDVDVDQLATFDLEYLFLAIRAKSVDDNATFQITDPDTGEAVELSLNINDVKLTTPEEHNKIVEADENTHIVMRYPSIDDLKFLTSKTEAEAAFGVMVSCIESIVSEDNIYKTEDFSEKEITDFVDSLSNKTIKDMQKFFDTIPVLRYEIPYKTKDGADKTFVVEGMESFFM